MTTDTKSKKTTSVIDFEFLPKVARDEIAALDPPEVATYIGMANKRRKNWDTPQYIAADGEHVIGGPGAAAGGIGNAWIVFGRDRNRGVSSGFGGKGAYHCGAIDIVVGRKGDLGKYCDDDGTKNFADTDFILDAARIYISQKADPDSYFELGEYSALWGIGTDPALRRKAGFTTVEDPRSTVAIKADTLRFIGRENIKIVTRTDTHNAQGGKTDNTYVGGYGIDLVATNDFKSLQPMVRGDNLRMCLKDIVDSIQSLRTLVENYINYNNKFQRKVMMHKHPPAIPDGKSPIFPDVGDLMPEGIDFAIKTALNVEVPCMLQHSQEVGNIDNAYLKNEGGSRSHKYILSTYNRNN